MFHLANQTRQSVAESFGKIPALAQQTRVSLGQCGEILGEVYFPTEGDDAISKMSGATGICCTAPILTWRGDPRETHSDWKIVVVTSETDSRTYHVHKSVLSTGPRSCEYFSKLFLEKNKPKKNKSQTTRIELDEQDADSFPLLLDFIYGTGQQRESNDDDASLVVGNDFTANEAVSLRHLAQLFDCEGLMLAVNKFIQRDLSLKTGPVYLVQAYSYQDKRLLEGAKLLCVENFLLLETGAVLRFPLQLFRSIVYSVAERSSASADDNSADDQTILSYHLSDVVCQYFEKHPKVLTVKILLGLTDEKIMPDIAPEAAIGFTALARELDSGDIAPESPEWIGLTILCERCAKAVVREYGWQDFNVASALHEFLDGSCSHEKGSKIDSLLFATSLASALDKAQRDSTPMNKCSSDSKRQLQNENTELRETNRGMRKEIEIYEDKLADTKEELRILKKQMKELKKRTR